MRTTIGLLGMLAFGVSVAVAQQPGPTVMRQRAAILLPPIESDPEVLPAVVRGVSDDVPPLPSTSPGIPSRPVPGLWAGSDPSVRQAGGVVTTTAVGSVTPPSVATDDSSGVSRGLDKIKGALGSTPASGTGEAKAQPNANTPYRGTTPNGSTVFAGPPAYRWYGWGSVTPGANSYAPTGQYPKVSANWYSITGATPGAFPVPVMNPVRPPTGTEPPAYVATPTPRSTPTSLNQPVISAPAATQTAPQASVTDVNRPVSAVDNRLSASLPVAPPIPPTRPVETPSIPVATLPPPAWPALTTNPITTAPPAVSPSLQANASPAQATPSAPTIPVVPTMQGENPLAILGSSKSNLPSQLNTAGTAATPDPTVPRAITMMPNIPVPPGTVGEAAASATEARPVPVEQPTTTTAAPAPAALPVSVTEYQLRWQPTSETATGGEWTTPAKPRPASTPASVPASAPAATPGTTPALPVTPAPTTPNWQQPGATDTTQSPRTARGQSGDTTPDPVVSLIRRLCDARAEGVDVRWTGSKRISVCFECQNAMDAQRLVRDISARPELTPYRIDFCVLVK